MSCEEAILEILKKAQYVRGLTESKIVKLTLGFKLPVLRASL